MNKFFWSRLIFGGLFLTFLWVMLFPLFVTTRAYSGPQRTNISAAHKAKVTQLRNAAWGAWKKERDLPKAETLYRELVVLSQSSDDFFSLAQVLEEDNKGAEALVPYRRLLGPMSSSSYVYDPIVLLRYAELAEKCGEHDEAIKGYKRAVQSGHSLAGGLPALSVENATFGQLKALAYVAVGNEYYVHAEEEKASEAYTKAVRLEPNMEIAQQYYAAGAQQTKK